MPSTRIGLTHATLRTEKAEDARARAAIKAQIEADKRERAEKAAREKALREGKSVPEASASTPAAPMAAPSAAAVAGRDFKETRLQIRLASGGPPLTTSLSSDARRSTVYASEHSVDEWPVALREVAEFVASQSLAFSVDTVTFTQQFPRYVPGLGIIHN